MSPRCSTFSGAVILLLFSLSTWSQALDENEFECPSSCICDGHSVECYRTLDANERNKLPRSTSLKYTESVDTLTISRQRRAVAVEPSDAPSTVNGAPGGALLFPCDFEQGFCQWYHSSDSDFTWTRNQGPTRSWNTGPDADHTTGAGWYIYTEASVPRRYGDRARLTSPTLAPVEPNTICKMEFFLYMMGGTIGTLNIYQAPVEGHDIVKRTWSGEHGAVWMKGEVSFDSREIFQIIVEGVRGHNYNGDIAIDDITFSSGCRRTKPSYVRLSNGTEYYSGLVQVWLAGDWHQVCSTGWTTQSSNVACKELGFVNATATNTLSYPLQSSHQGLYNVSCTGIESSVSACPAANLTDLSPCSSNKSASLVCSGVAEVCPAITHLRCRADAQGIKKCISRGQLCDFREDCWDGSDEVDCANYTRCSFENGFCSWEQAKNDHMNWTRHRGNTPSLNTGPSADHNKTDRYYLYIEVSGRQGKESARLVINPRFQGNHAGLCKVRFWFHMRGSSIGTLRVYAFDKFSRQTIWTRFRSGGSEWGRAEVPLFNTSNSFQVIFEAEHSGFNYQGDIAIDDVSFTPECRPASRENVTCLSNSFPCGSGECIPLDKQCDFTDDCFDASDELNCGAYTPGRCNFDENFCGWTNATDDNFDWERRTGRTQSVGTGPPYDHTHGFGFRGHYIYIEASTPRVPNDIARLLSPQFMWSGVKNCKVRFFYHMYTSWFTPGTLYVKLLNTVTGQTVDLWQRSGNQGKRWLKAEVDIITNWPVAQVMFEGRRGRTYQSDIALDDISFSPECYPSEAVHVLRNYDVRLVGSGSSNQGRVEIYRVGEWGTVCNDGWDQKEADVVCRQLGYSQARVASHSYGPGKGQIWLDNLVCYGNESKLYACPHNGWANHDCTHNQDAGVICSLHGERKAIRFAGNRNHSRHGRLEIFHNNVWGSICYDSWDLHDGDVACQQLGFSGIEKITKESTDRSSKAVLDSVSCHGNESALDRCAHGKWGDAVCTKGYAGVVCKDDGAVDGEIRLAGGSSPANGRVEIFYRGEWGTVCEDHWTTANARVTCLELGFTSVAKAHQSFGPGQGRVWMDRVSCSGNETALTKCRHRGWGVNSCSHSEDVGVICSDNAYVGCYIDRKPSAMAHISSSPVMTVVKCVRLCQERGYQYAGLQWSSECYCGDQYDKYGNTSNTECNTPCSGDFSKKCGGTWRLSVYATNPAILPSTAPGYAAVRQSCEQYRYSGIRSYYHIVKVTTNYFKGDHASGEIWSPNFPSNYPDLTFCVWVLNLHPQTKAHIEFEHFETELRHDVVTVKDGKQHFDSDLTPFRRGFSGTTASSLTASGNVMWIRFESDFSDNKKGFKLKYSAKGLPTTAPPTTSTPGLSTTFPPTLLPTVQYIRGECIGGSEHKSTFDYHDKYHASGNISSPGFPSDYPPNTECHWGIYVQEEFQIRVTVVTLNVVTGDRLDITDDYKTWHSKSQPDKNFEFISRHNYVRVTFVSDGKMEGKGFKLEYERIRPVGLPLHKTEEGLSKSMIGGIVLVIVLVPIVIAFVVVAIKKKKARRPQGVRHTFVNEAYDSVGDLNLRPAPTTQTRAAGEPVVHYAVAPPPYSQFAPAAIQIPPTALTPVRDDGAQPQAPPYAQLYAIPVAPPVYEAGSVRASGANTTVTGLGSVTNIRDAARDSGLPQSQPMVLSRHTVLPPIRGTVPPAGIAGSVAGGDEKKTPINDDEAGPLPQKVPVLVQTPPETHPSAPRSLSAGSLRVVSPPPSAFAFDQEPPFEFLCPITNQVMTHPVTAADGYTYERRAIHSWLRRNPTSPMTGNPITDETLKANHELKARIEDFAKHHSTKFSSV